MDQLLQWIESYGTPAIILLIALEYACFPISSELVLPFAGAFGAGIGISLPLLILYSSAAGLAGTSLTYAIGRYGGAETTSDFDKEKLQERLAKLSGGVAVIRVGAATETEMKESKLRLEDALAATKAAVEEGVIAGGGSAYIHASKDVEKLIEELQGDEKTGAKIILKALEAPLFHIVYNAGLEGAVIINKVKESEAGTGFDALKENYVNMIEAGILDPAKVTRSALQNATSVASTLLTTESVVGTIKEDIPPMPAGGGMGGMM